MSSKAAVDVCNHVVFLREEYPYTRNQVNKLFQCEGEKLNRILQHLRALKYVKINKTKDIQEDMTPLADEAVDIGEILASVNGYRYTFTFVGVLVVGDIVLESYPKYFSQDSSYDEQYDKFKLVIKVLKKFNKENQILRIYVDGSSGASFNILELMLFLMEEYYEKGLYNNNCSVIEINGEGDILWSMTVNQSTPLFKNGRPIYTDLYTTKLDINVHDYIRRLHACILTLCSRFFKKNKLFDIFDNISEIELSEDSLENFGEPAYIIDRLDIELGRQFNTNKRQILQSLRTFIIQNLAMRSSEYTVLYGTTAFNMVWEKACASVFCSQLYSRLRDIERNIIGGIRGEYRDRADETLADLIDKPVWVKYDNNYKKLTSTVADSTLIPDIISVYNLAGETHFAIFDAKYYVMSFNPLRGQPGIGDITKQYLYNLAYKNFIDTHDIKRVQNCFFMPMDSSCAYKVGYTNLSILNFLHVRNIDVILLPANTVFEYYVNNKKWDEGFLKLLNMINRENYGSVIAW